MTPSSMPRVSASDSVASTKKKDDSQYHGITPTARHVLEKRYLMKNENGVPIEGPRDMFRRIAKNVASTDAFFGATPEEVVETEELFFGLMDRLEFLAGMSLRNAGRKLQQLAACYVLPIEDNMDSIYTTLKHAALLHKTGAGVGYDFSRLRAQNAIVASTGGKSCGPIGFMKLFEFSCRTIVWNAATRRPGNMGILRVDHPDIMDFINAKVDNNELNNFNISVAATDFFMDQVEKDDVYDLIDPNTKEVVDSVKAREIFNLICDRAWASAEPGMIFIDRINEYNPTPHIGRMESTNQCGEQPLLPYEACNLGSIALSKMLKDENKKKVVDWEKLERTIRAGVHFLDNTIDINEYPIEEIRVVNMGNRKIGLGIMGYADMLIELQIPYQSDEALSLGEKLMKFIHDIGHDESRQIAKKRGSFPNFPGSKYEKEGYTEMRNATVTTIAPTGTTAIIANCSSGLEPLFALVYIRKNWLDLTAEDEMVDVNPIFEDMAKKRWFYSKELMEKVALSGSLKDIEGIPNDVKTIFQTSHDIDPLWHVKMQAVFQKYTDNAVSKTVNMPHESTIEDVRKVYMYAYKTGCKGITIYRDGSREKQVLNLKK